MRNACPARLAAGLFLLAWNAHSLAADSRDEACWDAWQKKESFKIGFHCKAGAEAGLPKSQYAWGRYQRSEKNYAEAFELIGQSASQGFAPAYTVLGEMHMVGRGTEKNRCEAITLFDKGAQAGDPTGYRRLAETLPVAACGGAPDHAGAQHAFEKYLETPEPSIDADLAGLMALSYLSHDKFPKGHAWARVAKDLGSTKIQPILTQLENPLLMTAADREESNRIYASISKYL